MIKHKILIIALSSLCLVSIAYGKCYPGLDCPADLPSGSTQIPAPVSQENVVATASGLQYEVLNRGNGKVSPLATDTVTVHYKGVTLDGVEFDSSYSRAAPASFPLNRVIEGWTEGVQLMKEGDKFRFYIPPNLAYGSEGAGSLIPPNATLIFDIELIKIEK